MKGLYVIGTDTGVGKTTVCAGLLKLLYGNKKVRYWKPIQTAAIVADDFHEVQELTGLPQDAFIEPHFRFPEPLTPHMAARKWNKHIEVEPLAKFLEEEIARGTFPIVEGAGGLLVPYSDHAAQIDFMKRVPLPIILVGQDRVGTVNQALLTLRAAREAKLEILGMVLTRQRGTFGNAETITEFGKVEILVQLPDSANKPMLAGEVASNSRLRDIFKVPRLP